MRPFSGDSSLSTSRCIDELRRSAGSVESLPPLVRVVPRPPELPLSFAQERLWSLQQLEKGSVAFHIPEAWMLRGLLDVAALAGALGEVVRRHETLRTRFPALDGCPWQEVTSAGTYDLPRIDLASLPPAVRGTEARRLLGAEVRRPFDLAQDLPLRALLLRLFEAEHLLFVNVHHIASDGGSEGVFHRELSTLYDAIAARRPSPLRELAVQYADYALWQRRYLTGAVLRRQLGSWRSQLAGLTPLRLMTDRPRPAVRTGRGAVREIVLGAGLSRAVKGLSAGAGVSLFMGLLAAVMALFHRFSGQPDIVVGTAVANRHPPAVEPLIGFFVNPLVLRGDLSGDANRLSFDDLLSRVREVCLMAYAHQSVPFEKLVEEVEPERDLSRSPLFQVMFLLQNAPREPFSLRGIEVKELPLRTGRVHYDLTVELFDIEERIRGAIRYDADLFDGTTMARMVRSFSILLAAVAADSSRCVRTLPISTDAERQQLLVECNDSATSFRAPRFLHDLVAAQMERTPTAIAVTFGDERLSYDELGRRARHLAGRLCDAGVRPEARVGVLFERGIDLVVAFLAVLEAGGAYVPLDPAWPAARLAWMVEDARIEILLAGRGQRATWSEHRLLRLEPDVEGGAEDRGWRRADLAEDNTAYVLYTSGSTGVPKGVMVSHRAIVHHTLWMQHDLPMTAKDRLLQKTPLGFDASVGEIWGPLVAGARLVLAPSDAHQDPATLVAELVRHEITILHLVPSLLRLLLDERDFRGLRGLRRVESGGEPLTAELRERFFAHGPPAELVNLYGPTEATIHATFARCLPGGRRGAVPPLGRPIANTRVYLLGEDFRPVPRGSAGRLHVCGPGLARGYLGRPARTARSFVPNPWSVGAGERLYDTGDLARYLADGSIEYLGRQDRQVKLRGYRIEPGEVEAVLAEHPAIRQAVATVLCGNAAARLVAFLQPRRPQRPSTAELRASLTERLPAPMIPTAFAWLDELPLNTSGKVDRAALERAAAAAFAASTGGAVPPRSATEVAVAEVVSEILGTATPSVHESFFELGGHSLLALRVLTRIRRLFGVELPLSRLFEGPSVAQLAAQVEALRRRPGAATPGSLEPLTPASATEERWPSFAQERLWFLQHLAPESPSYNVPRALWLEGPLDAEALVRSLREVTLRHQVLRTRLPEVDGRPSPVLDPPGHGALTIDLTRPGEAARSAETARLLAREARRPFDLASKPPARHLVIVLARDDHVVFQNVHHVAWDDASAAIFDRELSAAYLCWATNPAAPSPLGRLPAQYADFACWQRRHLRREVLEDLLAWWRRQLAGLRPVALPSDRPRPRVWRSRGAAVPLGPWPSDLDEPLSALRSRFGVSSYMTLVAVVAALQHRLTGAEDAAFGAPISHRCPEEVEGLIGLFVNTLVLRISTAGGRSLAELLARVRETCLEAYDHQEMPFERLVEGLRIDRDLGRPALFQVMVGQSYEGGEGGFRHPGLRCSGEPVENDTTHFDLIVTLTPRGGEIRYSTDLFDRTSILRWNGYLVALLEAFAREPGKRLFELSILTPAEEHQLLREWSGAPEIHREGCLGELFEAQAERTPDAEALICGEERWSYRELAGRAQELAGRLRRLGVGPEVVVGVELERVPETVAAILGVLLAGGAYLPLDLRTPPERRERMLVESGAAALVTRREILPRRAASAGGRVRSGNAAYVLFTSGSSGRPKGVVVEHRQVLSYVAAVVERLVLPPGASFVLVQPLSVDSSKTTLFPPLLSGGRLHLVGERDATDPDALARLFEREQIDVLKIAPSHLAALVEGAGALEFLPAQALVVGGEAWPGDWPRRWGSALGRCRLFNHYGPTEVTVGTHARRVTAPAAAVGIGRPLGNSIAFVADGWLRPVPAGVAGELLLGGAGLARGYLGRPGRTAASFVPHPFAATPGARLYRSGDLARLGHDGALALLGRLDDQIKVRGFRVEPGEVEAALGEHPGVAASAVAGRGEPARLVAYVRATSHPAPDLAELRRFLRPLLPEHMLPEALVVLDELPRTPHGKIDRTRLLAPEPRETGGGEEPRGEAEGTIAEVWRQVLGLEHVGAEESFFDLGGHSLLLLQVLSRLRRRLDPALKVVDLLRYPTPRSLAQVLQGAPVARRERPGAQRLTRRNDMDRLRLARQAHRTKEDR